MTVEVEDLIGLWDVAFPSPSPKSASHAHPDVEVPPASPSPSPAKPNGQSLTSDSERGGTDSVVPNEITASAGSRPPSPTVSTSPSSTSHRSLSLSATAPAFQPSTPKVSSGSAKSDRLEVVRSRTPPSFFTPVPPPRAQGSEPAISPVLSPRASKAVRISPPKTPQSVSGPPQNMKGAAVVNLIDAEDESDDSVSVLRPAPATPSTSVVPEGPTASEKQTFPTPESHGPTPVPSPRSLEEHHPSPQAKAAEPQMQTSPAPPSTGSDDEPAEPAKVHRATRLSISSPTHPPLLVSPRASPVQSTFQQTATASVTVVGEVDTDHHDEQDESRPLSTPTSEGDGAFVEDVAVFDEQWAAFREAIGGFSGGVEEFVARVKDHFRSATSTMTGPDRETHRTFRPPAGQPEQSEANSHLIAEQRATIGRQEDQMSDLRGLLQVAKADLERIKIQREEDRQALDLWEGRAHQLADQHLELEGRFKDAQRVLELRGMAMAASLVHVDPCSTADLQEASFGSVILDADPRLFGSEILASGRDGGRQVFQNLVEYLTSFFDELPTRTYIYIFIDVTRVAKNLINAGWIERHADLQDVLDGFSASNELCFVIDALEDGQGCGPRQKLLAHLDACARNPICKWVIVGAVDEPEYRPILQELEPDCQGRLSFIRSAENIDAEPFAKWSSGRLLAIPGLYTLPYTPRTPRGGKRLYLPSEASSTAGPGRVDSSNFGRPITPSAASDYSTRLYSSSHPPDSPPPTPKPRIPPPPWERRQQVIKVAETSAPSASGSLQDQYWASKGTPQADDQTSSTTGLQIRGRALREARPTVSVSSLDRSPTPRGSDRQGERSRVAYRIPVREERDGSIGESPPTSDEDNPAVKLPHSAVKHVQRPTTSIDVSPSRAGSVVPSTTAISALELPSRAASLASRIHPSRAGQITASRPAPVPSKTSKATASARSTGTNGVPLGKSKYGNLGNDAGVRSASRPAESIRAEMKARRTTTEYNVLRHLDPPPCHPMYLRGACTNPRCKYGHSYSIPPQGIVMLRMLAKEMNCRRVLGDQCTESEVDCLYSHVCPYGPDCPYLHRGTCWFATSQH